MAKPNYRTMYSQLKLEHDKILREFDHANDRRLCLTTENEDLRKANASHTHMRAQAEIQHNAYVAHINNAIKDLEDKIREMNYDLHRERAIVNGLLKALK